MTKIRESVALGVFAVLCAPTIVAAGDLSDPGVRNGSFCDPTNSDWMRSSPNLTANDGSLFCDESRLISFGRSVVHAPEYISDGNETSLPIPPGTSDDCTFPSDERTAVLRMRANHPWAPNRNTQRYAAQSVANVYQADIRLQSFGGMSSPDGHVPVVLLRFDCFALHPLGGTAVEARLIAEKFDDNCDLIPWGNFPNLLPFGVWSSDSRCAPLVHTMNVLGSPVYRYTDCDGEHHEHWLPRQVPRTSSGEDCEVAVVVVESFVKDKFDPPSADWRTVEMRVDVRQLPDWNTDENLDQIMNYRFTIAFRLPEEAVVLKDKDDMSGCNSPVTPNCSWTSGDGGLDQSFRLPSYVELDQVELRLATLDPSDASPCDLLGEPCDSSSTSGQWCRASTAGVDSAPLFAFEVSGAPLAVEFDGSNNVSCENEIASSRNDEAIVYDYQESEVFSECDVFGTDLTVNACAYCGGTSGSLAPIYRPIREESFEPATDPVLCAGDFNGDGVVNGADFGAMLSAWGACSGCQEDLNGDGEVTGADVGLLLTMWGACP
jgi:hypothetical protein